VPSALEPIKIDYKKDITSKRRPVVASLFLNNHKITDCICKTSFKNLDRTPRDVNAEKKLPQQTAGYSG